MQYGNLMFRRIRMDLLQILTFLIQSDLPVIVNSIYIYFRIAYEETKSKAQTYTYVVTSSNLPT